MKILYISIRTTVHDRRFLQAMVDGGHHPFFLRTRPELDADRILNLPEEVLLLDGTDVSEAVHAQQPDLIHAGPVPQGAYMAAQTGFTPLISMSWGSDLLREIDADAESAERARYALERSSLLLADCDAVKQKAVQLGFPEEKVVTFPWGIDLTRYQPGRNKALRNELGWEDKFVIFHSRSWEEVYGVDMMAKGFAEACRQDPDLRLLLLGSGSLENELRSIFEQNGVMDKVHFAGMINQAELPAYYQAADLYLSASHSDGSSISLLEAMACGLPAVVTDIPGNREWIQQGSNGWLFPDGDWRKLSDQIMTAKADQCLDVIGAVNRAYSEAKADWQKNQQKLLDVYRIFE